MATNLNYGKINEDGTIAYAPSAMHTDFGWSFNPIEADYLAAGWLRIAHNTPETRDGYTSRRTGYEARDGKIWAVYEYSKIERTVEYFNAAVEEHLLDERTARGYDTREPSLYINSTVERWRQDAQDWVSHVDAVMTYALGVLKAWESTGSVPDFDEFKSRLPAIKWTVED